jgi:hypothetical protein
MNENTSPSDSSQPKPLPTTVSPQLIRQLPVAVIVTLIGVAVVIVAIVLLAGRPEWLPAFAAASVVAILCAIASLVIILSSAGKPADYVVTMVMLLAAVRVGVSIVGLLVAIMALEFPAKSTAMMICGYYAATLIVESVLVRRALNDMPTAKIDGLTDTLRGNQG